MFSTRAVNQKTNRPHEGGLIASLNDETLIFIDMLSKINDSTTHVKNIQKLITDVYKYLNGLSALILNDAFTKIMLKYNIRSCRITLLSNPKSKNYGTGFVAYKAAQIWSTLPTKSENLPSLDLFKEVLQ